MKCNGCGADIGFAFSIYAYGDNYEKTFCEDCHGVLKDIILGSDLSDHHDNQ